jgi:hypothetical protein
MFLSAVVSAIEASLITIEACNVIAMRTRMIARGDEAGRREAELMIAEKVGAFTRAGFDIAAGVSNTAICDNFRAAIQANERRLMALQMV